jgi:DNA-binding NarL/FixJ family response regulator
MKRRRVLIAEDHETMRCAIVALLCKGFHILGAVGNGEELVEAAACMLPDIIVSDILMPRMDGLTARNKLIDLNLTIPFVFLSGVGKDVIQILSNESPVGFVHKSDTSHHLRRAMRAVLTGRNYVSPHYR